MRVSPKSWCKIICPSVCLAIITSGKTEQSSKNWQKFVLSGEQCVLTISCIFGLSSQYFLVKARSLFLVLSRAWQCWMMWVISSGDWQEGDSLQCSVLLSHLLHNFWVLYLPDNMIAWHVAIDTLVGDAPAVVQSGWGVVKDMNSGWKYWREPRLVASSLSVFSQ